MLYILSLAWNLKKELSEAERAVEPPRDNRRKERKGQVMVGHQDALARIRKLQYAVA